jgi:hypothetical protein
MADSEILLQPAIQAELEQYRALEHRVQVSRQQCREFKELAKQVMPGNTLHLPVPLSDGSPAAELDAAFSALKQQIGTIHAIEARLNEPQGDSLGPIHGNKPSLRQQQNSVIRENMKIALYVVVGIVLFFLSLIVLHAINH